LPNTPLLTVERLLFERDDCNVFEQIDLEVGRGEIVQIEGPNGSGKTTLMRLLTTALQPTSGNIRYAGQAIDLCRYEYLSDILYVGHQPGVKMTLTAEENLRWMAADCSNSAQDALAAVGLAGYADIPCYNLSAGQHRRVALARLLMTNAKLWYLDEPFTAIDKQGVSFLESCMRDHIRRGGAVVLSTHQDLTIDGVRKNSIVPHADQGGF
jgi:heme exporter protein A